MGRKSREAEWQRQWESTKWEYKPNYPHRLHTALKAGTYRWHWATYGCLLNPLILPSLCTVPVICLRHPSVCASFTKLSDRSMRAHMRACNTHTHMQILKLQSHSYYYQIRSLGHLCCCFCHLAYHHLKLKQNQVTANIGNLLEISKLPQSVSPVLQYSLHTSGRWTPIPVGNHWQTQECSCIWHCPFSLDSDELSTPCCWKTSPQHDAPPPCFTQRMMFYGVIRCIWLSDIVFS